MKIHVGAAWAIVAWACLPLSASAAEGAAAPAAILTGDQIANALKPSGAGSARTRGLSRRPEVPAQESINLNIPFKYNSSALESSATDQLRQLDLALTSPALREDRFVVAGHTDAKGNGQYNKKLSRKRAESVKSFLVAHGVDTSRLDAVGYGAERPLIPERPQDPANRRVEIRDLGPASALPSRATR